jgi:hypothetical protein
VPPKRQPAALHPYSPQPCSRCSHAGAAAPQSPKLKRPPKLKQPPQPRKPQPPPPHLCPVLIHVVLLPAALLHPRLLHVIQRGALPRRLPRGRPARQARASARIRAREHDGLQAQQRDYDAGPADARGGGQPSDRSGHQRGCSRCSAAAGATCSPLLGAKPPAQPQSHARAPARGCPGSLRRVVAVCRPQLFKRGGGCPHRSMRTVRATSLALHCSWGASLSTPDAGPTVSETVTNLGRGGMR